MEVNEQIIEEYLKIKKMFYIHDIKFKVWGSKGGSNYSNIDFLAIDCNSKLYDIEVKFRSKYKLTLGSNASKLWINDIVEQITRKEREKEIEKYSKLKPLKILISTKICFGKGEEKRKAIEKVIRDKVRHYNIEFWYFEDIIEELRKKTSSEGRHDSPILQMIRLLELNNHSREKIEVSQD